MKILKQTALCGSCSCNCPSVNLTDKGSFLVAGSKTADVNKIALPLGEYLNAMNELNYKDGCDIAANHIDWEQTASLKGDSILFSGRVLDSSEHSNLKNSLDENESAVEISAEVFWSCHNIVSTNAA